MSYDVSHIHPEKTCGLDGSTLTEVHLEGSQYAFPALIPRTTPGFYSRRNNSECRVTLARNTSGSTLSPGRIVKWADGYRRRRFDGYAFKGGSEVVGVLGRCPAAATEDGHCGGGHGEGGHEPTGGDHRAPDRGSGERRSDRDRGEGGAGGGNPWCQQEKGT